MYDNGIWQWKMSWKEGNKTQDVFWFSVFCCVVYVLGLLSVKLVKACAVPWLKKKNLMHFNWLVRYGIDIPFI